MSTELAHKLLGYPGFYNYRQEKHLQRYAVIWASIAIALVFGIFLLCGCGNAEEIKWDSFSDEQIVNAIFKAEGGYRATYLYGIRSIPYKDEAEARQICLNSVRNGRARWLKAGKPCDLIIHIGLRYCPPTAHKLNSNWVKNVKYFLINQCS